MEKVRNKSTCLVVANTIYTPSNGSSRAQFREVEDTSSAKQDWYCRGVSTVRRWLPMCLVWIECSDYKVLSFMHQTFFTQGLRASSIGFQHHVRWLAFVSAYSYSLGRYTMHRCIINWLSIPGQWRTDRFSRSRLQSHQRLTPVHRLLKKLHVSCLFRILLMAQITICLMLHSRSTERNFSSLNVFAAAFTICHFTHALICDGLEARCSSSCY